MISHYAVFKGGRQLRVFPVYENLPLEQVLAFALLNAPCTVEAFTHYASQTGQLVVTFH
jgi:hypothetical protein